MYLVVGANGFLGSYLLKSILKKTNDTIIAVARNIDTVTENNRIRWISCDISNRLQVDALCDEILPEDTMKVIFLAAYHNPDLVEKNPNFAWNINVTSLSYFINKLENVKCLFYPSTDSVYGNSIGGYKYKECDKLSPVNTYGKQKCAAESIIVWHEYNVVRYPFLIAPSLSPIKKHFYDVITEHLVSGKEIPMFTDSFRSSLNFATGADLLIDLVETYTDEMPKILNICGDSALSKYDIGLLIAEKLNANKDLVVPISTAGVQEIFEARRAQSTLMDNTRLKEILGVKEIKLEI